MTYIVSSGALNSTPTKFCAADNRPAGAPAAMFAAWRHRSDASDARLPRRLRRPLHVHDRQQSQELALLRQVHRLLPDPDRRQGGEYLLYSELLLLIDDDGVCGLWNARIVRYAI